MVIQAEFWDFSEEKLSRTHPGQLKKEDLDLIFDFPTVYIVTAKRENAYNSRSEYTAYVGETNNITVRTAQHMKADPTNRDDWRELSEKASKDPASVDQYVIGHPHFNKSLTLDVENRMMQYLVGVDAVTSLNNRRTNPQGNYYPRNELDSIFSKAWKRLHAYDSELFPTEALIQDSALFKASPFHYLSREQREAEEQILSVIEEARTMPDSDDSEFGKLVLVRGAAGTGKTVLISHLFNRLVGNLDETDEDGSNEDLRSDAHVNAFLLINHAEQRHVYNEIARKLNLQSKPDEVVLKPSSFINNRTDWDPSEGKNKKGWAKSGPMEKVDVVLIDEAHLLLTQSSRAYFGENMLLDIMRRAKTTVAVFDPDQILSSEQQWDDGDRFALLDSKAPSYCSFENVALRGGNKFERAVVTLRQQFRIAANDEMVRWIDNFVDGKPIEKIPESTSYVRDGKTIEEKYDIRVFDSPVDLFQAIVAINEGDDADKKGLSRVLATYDWPYSSKENESDPDGFWNVELHQDTNGEWKMGLAEGDHKGNDGKSETVDPHRFCRPWNYMLSKQSGGKSVAELSWAEKPETLGEIGSTYTIQGFDLNVAGVIIGPSVKYRDGRVVFEAEGSENKKATQKKRGVVDYSEQNLHNELNVLLKRGVHGLYLFAVDSELQKALKNAACAE